MKQNLTLEQIDSKIAELQKRIDEINEQCARDINEITIGADTRILSYAQNQKLNVVIEDSTKKLAKLMVDLEELEKLKSEQ